MLTLLQILYTIFLTERNSYLLNWLENLELSSTLYFVLQYAIKIQIKYVQE